MDMSSFGILAGMFERCNLMLRVEDAQSDGAFGKREHYETGPELLAALQKQQSREGQLAEAQSLKEEYRVVVCSDVELFVNDVLRRQSDGLTLRVTSNTRDGAAPGCSTVAIAKCTAEVWELP